MSQIPAPLLSRHVGVLVVVLSVLASAGLLAASGQGGGWLVAAIVLAAIQHAFLALAILLIGRTGLAGRHALLPVLATFGSAAVLVLDALAEVVGAILAVVGALPSRTVVTLVGVALLALTALLLVAFGAAVLHARVVRPSARALPLLAGLVALATAAALALAPDLSLLVAPAVAVLVSGGIGLALFTRRTLP